MPYVLEGIWLLAGYQLGAGVLSPLALVGLWLAVVAGRQVGSLALYRVLRFGAGPLGRLYNRLRASRFWPKGSLDRKLSDRISSLSAFASAYGRLIGLSFPVALALAAKRRPLTLVKAVVLSSLVWDGIYLALGITVGNKALLSPGQMLVAALGGMTALYSVAFGARYWFRLMRSVRTRTAV